MKILLAAVNAKYIHSNLAVYCLRAYAKEQHPASNITISEYTINQPFDEILMDIYKQAPDVLCLSCYLWNMTEVGQLIQEIPKILPDTKIWLGGPEVSYNAREVLEKYPHQLSGGMLQRIMIGSAMALQPELLIADEPTTAIDAVTQYEILEEFVRIKKNKNTAMLFITHDLGAISKVADRILVMNSGQIVDSGDFEHIRNHSQDPYTRFLIEKRSAANSHNYYVIIHHFLPLLFTLLRKYLFHSSLPDKANHQIS